MANVAIFDPLKTPNPITQYIPSANTPEYIGKTNALINPDVSLVAGLEMKYWKHVAGTILPMTISEMQTVDLDISTAFTLSTREIGKTDLDNGPGIILRAIADITKDEFNILRQWLMSFKSEVASSTNLSNLQTRVAGLSNLPDRTLDQLRTAIKNRIDSGSVDA